MKPAILRFILGFVIGALAIVLWWYFMPGAPWSNAVLAGSGTLCGTLAAIIFKWPRRKPDHQPPGKP